MSSPLRAATAWKRVPRATVLLFALALWNCSIFRTQSRAEDAAELVTITVINHNVLDMTLYSVRQGGRERLGDVTAAMSSSFKVPLRRFPGNELQLYADPIGSNRGVTSEILHLSGGDVVEWTSFRPQGCQNLCRRAPDERQRARRPSHR